MADNSTQATKPLLGIGSCLAGNEVRYNGQAKKPNQHVRELCEHFDIRSFCPEMGIGLGVPRPPIHLVGSADAIRVMDVATQSKDFTEPLRAYADQVLATAPGLSGYILVKGSPSCGYDRVKRYDEHGNFVASDQQGIFAAALALSDPLLPLEDDGRLNDPGLRESFATRACTYHDWKLLISRGIEAKTLLDFYSRHKYLVMAHHAASYKVLGPMLANIKGEDIEDLGQRFIRVLMAALAHRATRRSHSNVLFHLSGYLKRRVPGTQRQRLAELIEAYRVGQLPLVVPVTLLKHHFADNPNAYIDNQSFFAPYPEGLKLRNLL